ncbi:uncharacterized protein K489DRAFT_64916 [Dissoconium aciculare CBS 342.82]|uniref:Uncharacterized protein n=1 Tax=Dissoconium aciculare CBS 342.82 TaxID=1314786 RepID=A0A6J3LUB5_9PEZI|nr:uncharacterized protein K489DRAFT_64916 [Dissoconium aciculare CBS 342.82]KAF1819376.1 hypothetical protein K489DRAFT_64916 [Dissoconium aciculare CBS 342.82]
MGAGVGGVFPEAEEQIIDPGAVFVADAALSLGWSVLSLLSPMLSPFSLLPCPGGQPWREIESMCETGATGDWTTTLANLPSRFLPVAWQRGRERGRERVVAPPPSPSPIPPIPPPFSLNRFSPLPILLRMMLVLVCCCCLCCCCLLPARGAAVCDLRYLTPNT